MKKSVAFIVCALLVASTYAVTVRGVRSCGKWIAAHPIPPSVSADSLAQESWLVGYLSGVSVESNVDVLKNVDNESIFLWMNNYCQQNPLMDIGDGGYTLFLELKRKVDRK